MTGQEMPGVAKVMREGPIQKAHLRRPSVSSTTICNYHKTSGAAGWKRFEMNDTPKFRGTTEVTLDSIYKRSLVTELKAKFLCRQELLRRFPGGDNEVSGVFEADPSFKDFLNGPDAAAAFLRKLENFMTLYSEADCCARLRLRP